MLATSLSRKTRTLSSALKIVRVDLSLANRLKVHSLIQSRRMSDIKHISSQRAAQREWTRTQTNWTLTSER